MHCSRLRETIISPRGVDLPTTTDFIATHRYFAFLLVDGVHQPYPFFALLDNRS